VEGSDSLSSPQPVRVAAEQQADRQHKQMQGFHERLLGGRGHRPLAESSLVHPRGAGIILSGDRHPSRRTAVARIRIVQAAAGRARRDMMRTAGRADAWAHRTSTHGTIAATHDQDDGR
jgi:hypothetical protein